MYPRLCEAIGIACNPNEWRLFIDSSSRSFKAVLLHNGKEYTSLPLAHLVHLKEEYNSVKTLLEALKYDEYDWEVIGDFKLVVFLMGLQERFTKFPYFFAFGTAGTLCAQNSPRSLVGRTKSLGKLCRSVSGLLGQSQGRKLCGTG
ncbi:uncharacterized protein LOC143257152 [Tachypleus tridentatus]|uniref:uncharacterized protein LOC143257152 n=1 Tax=Tachypleus tridentatus TaxID=6853 RepID=UPI003FD45B50